MEVSLLYSLAAGGILVIFITIRALSIINNELHNNNSLRAWVFRHVIYPKLHLIFPLPYYEFTLQLLYWGGNITSNLVGVRTLKDASMRAAQLSLANLAPLLMTSSLDLSAWLAGLSLRAVLRIHNSIALVTLSEAVFHIVTSFIVFRPLQYRLSPIILGLTATSALAMLIGALFLRKPFYEIFLPLHVLCALVMGVTLYLHARNQISKTVIAVSLGMFLMSGMFRIGRALYRSPVQSHGSKKQAMLRKAGSRFTVHEASHAEDRHVPRPTHTVTRYQYCLGRIVREGQKSLDNGQKHDPSVIRLSIELPRPWNIIAGQHVQLCLPKLGFWSLMQSHPFMVTWWDNGDNGVSIDLIVEKKHGFTSRLLDFAKTQQDSAFPVLLDGPYGKSAAMEEYGTVVLLADDIGIVSVLPYAKQLLHSASDNKSITSKVILIWRHTNQDLCDIVRPLFNELLTLDGLFLDQRSTNFLDVAMDLPTTKQNHHLKYYVLSIIEVDRSAPLGYSENHGRTGRAVTFSGDHSVESLLSEQLRDRPGKKLIAVACNSETKESVAKLAYNCKDSSIVFEDLSADGWDFESQRLALASPA